MPGMYCFFSSANHRSDEKEIEITFRVSSNLELLHLCSDEKEIEMLFFCTKGISYKKKLR